MIDVNDLQYLTTEDFEKMIKEFFDAQRALLNDQELVITRYIKDRYLSTVEVAEMLKCTPGQIPKDIPCVHLGRNYIFSKADVEKWFNSHKKMR